MPREREFDEDRVLQSAADAFTSRGFQGTSLATLIEATGLGKQSLYNAFGDKRSLYLQALDCAVARFAGVQGEMKKAENGRTAIARFFDHLLAQCASDDPARRNCIVSVGLLEGVDDESIAARLRDKWSATHELLRSSIERGQKDGSIRNAMPSAALADLLMSLMSGLRVSARADVDAARMQRTAALALSLLDHEAPLESP